MKKELPSYPVSIKFDGKAYETTYTYSARSDVILVSSFFGSASTRARGSGGLIIARLMLREILERAKAGGLL
jgi:hypothetical protein